MYRKKGRGWTKHIDFMILDIICILIAFFISYVIRFGFNNPYVDKDYRILGVAFLLIDFFVEIMADSFKNVLKRGYLDEFISTCKHAVLVFLVTALFLFTTQMADIYSRLSFYIMFPIYVTITYVARLALKSFLEKRDFGVSKKSLFVIAPDAILRDTLRTVEKSCIGYTKIVAASLDTDMKTPIVVPRQHQFNEHVNNHQVEFARNVAQRMGTIIPVEDINTLGDIITNYDQIVAGMGHGMSSNNAKFNEELEKLVDELY